jgi:hypothetical protein
VERDRGRRRSTTHRTPQNDPTAGGEAAHTDTRHRHSSLFSSIFVRPKVLLQQCNIIDALIPEEPPGRQKLDHAVARRGRERLRGAEIVAATGAEERHGRAR